MPQCPSPAMAARRRLLRCSWTSRIRPRRRSILASRARRSCRHSPSLGCWRTRPPFATDDPTAPIDDLEPLRALVGDARIVGMGEGSHGTREFFRMKHRVFEFLVERMGFTIFAIEATFPEALDVDRYVRTGEGDPSALIRGMYFWTWNTDEVLDLVRWMRNYNVAAAYRRFDSSASTSNFLERHRQRHGDRDAPGRGPR